MPSARSIGRTWSGSCGNRSWRRHRHIEIPPAAGVLRKAPGAQLVSGKPEAIPEREPAALEEDLPVGITYGAGFEGNPPERAASTPAHAPAQPRLAMLMPPRDVFFGHLLENGRADRQPLAARAVEIALKLMCADETVLPPQHLQGEIVAVVPHEIHRAGHLREHSGVLVLEAQSKDSDRSLAVPHTVQMYRLTR